MPTILVVEDDGETAAWLALVLRDAGYHVLQVADGRAALRVLGIIRAHLVLTDVRMPVLDGRTLCQTLAADPRHQDLPRVLMSGIWEDLGPLPGVRAFLRKPVTLPVLLATVDQALHTVKPLAVLHSHDAAPLDRTTR